MKAADFAVGNAEFLVVKFDRLDYIALGTRRGRRRGRQTHDFLLQSICHFFRVNDSYLVREQVFIVSVLALPALPAVIRRKGATFLPKHL